MIARLSALLLVCSVLGLGGCAGQSAGSPGAWYSARNAVEPTSDRVVICHAFGCERRTPIRFGDKDLTHLREVFAQGEDSPASEREAIAQAVQWSEERVAISVGSQNDIGGLDMKNAGVPGQMDCIDEATNTTSVLLIAEKQGFLKHHRYPHATAVVIEKGSGTGYAIDSWPHRNGVAPDIMTLTAWFDASPAN